MSKKKPEWVKKKWKEMADKIGELPTTVLASEESLPEVINFYSQHGYYGEFSNFAPYPIHLDGKKWKTTEHYFQAQKFKNSKLQAKVRGARTPGLAAAIGRNRSNPLRRDWEKVKIDVMRKAVHAKFTQHQDLRKLLVETGDAIIVEHTKNDKFWGDGGNGHGQNWLGKILMEIREEIK